MTSSRKIEWFSTECGKTEAKEITQADHKGRGNPINQIPKEMYIYVADPQRRKKICKSVTVGFALTC